MATAFHEAGHAVVCLVCHGRVEYATILATPHDATSFNAGHSEMATGRMFVPWVSLAGPAAERRYLESIGAPLDEVRRHGETDYVEARKCLPAPADDEALQQAEAEAAQYVLEHWSSIERLAHALLETRVLTGEQIDALLSY